MTPLILNLAPRCLLLPGVASKLALRVPGSAGPAGLEPSMDSSAALVPETPDFFLLWEAFWMDAASVGRLASWWKTFLLRMMAYTRLEFPVGDTSEPQSGL